MAAPFVRLPSLTIARGVPVTVVDGSYEPVADEHGTPLRAADVLALLVAHKQPVVLIDADGIASDRPQLDVVRTLSEQANDARVDLWVDCGPRHLEGVYDVVMASGGSAILSTRTLTGLDLLTAAAASCDGLVLSIDVQGGNDVIAFSRELRTSIESLLQLAAQLGVGAAILQRTGTSPWDVSLLRNAITRPPPVPTYLAGPGSGAHAPVAAELGLVGWVAGLLEVLEAVDEDEAAPAGSG